jgi:hypothetical protein
LLPATRNAPNPHNLTEEGHFLSLLFMKACPFKAASTDKCVLISYAQRLRKYTIPAEVYLFFPLVNLFDE